MVTGVQCVVAFGGRRGGGRTETEDRGRENEYRSSRYTALNFLPLNLLEQFRRVANFYFLLITLVQLIPDVSPFPLFTTVAPLVFILGVSACKEGYEDWLRHRRDAADNHRQIELANRQPTAAVASMHLRVGDVVRLHEGEECPADLVLLASSAPGGLQALCDSANLDGESAVKRRFAPACAARFLEQGGRVVCDLPSPALQGFCGRLEPEGEAAAPLGDEALLLRGVVLRHTEWADGLVLFAGGDTKLVLNQQCSRFKQSGVERDLNVYVLGVLAMQVAFSALVAALARGKDDLWADGFEWDVDTWSSAGDLGRFSFDFFTIFILLSFLVPISLYVSLELSKLGQSLFMEWDLQLEGATANTSSIGEELGLVEVVLSDKTGTLTANCMRYREAHRADDGDLFGLALALCNSALVVPEGFSSESPDEVALLEAARDEFSLCLEARTPDSATVSGQAYDTLAVLPFSPELRRMAVLVRDQRTGRVLLLSKGADVAMARFVRDEQEAWGEAERQVDRYAGQGLRTLVFAGVELSQAAADAWLQSHYSAAAGSVEGRAAAVAAAFALLEPQQRLLGVTAVEDALQEFVPETVTDLLAAGIRVAMLTGDKLETAVKIGLAAGLLRPDSPQLVVRSAADLSSTAAAARAAGTVMVITGDAVVECLDAQPARFCELFLACASAVCCRMTPNAKAAVVRMVKGTGRTCLAIGDGANDVSMLRESHVGVGLRGKEGVQAANAADFALHRFHHLRRLLLVHGRLAYVRTSLLIKADFYKNAAFNLCMLWFQFYCGYSGQVLFGGAILSLFNTLFTTPACVALSLVAKDVDEDTMLAVPQAYFGLRGRPLFNAWVFTKWMAGAVAQSLAAFFVVMPGAAPDLGLWTDGFAVSLAAIWGVHATLLLQTELWTWLNAATLLASVASVPLIAVVYAGLQDADMQGAAVPALESPAAMLSVLLVVAGVALVQMAWKHAREPTPEDHLRVAARRRRRAGAEPTCAV